MTQKHRAHRTRTAHAPHTHRSLGFSLKPSLTERCALSQEAIFDMAKVKIEEAQRAATLAIKVACSISDEKLNSVVRGIFGELERLLLPPGQRLLTSAAEASLELHMRALELGAERTFIAAGEAVCVDVEKALRKLITSPAYRLATPSFDGSHKILVLREYTM